MKHVMSITKGLQIVFNLVKLNELWLAKELFAIIFYWWSKGYEQNIYRWNDIN